MSDDDQFHEATTSKGMTLWVGLCKYAQGLVTIGCGQGDSSSITPDEALHFANAILTMADKAMAQKLAAEHPPGDGPQDRRPG